MHQAWTAVSHSELSSVELRGRGKRLKSVQMGGVAAAYAINVYPITGSQHFYN
uniref:Uncharacterized protein n=1 Tax=Anguilla anguilla TaxID=7936 RepID=A0A0E9WA85_ANGAN